MGDTGISTQRTPESILWDPGQGKAGATGHPAVTDGDGIPPRGPLGGPRGSIGGEAPRYLCTPLRRWGSG